MCSIVQNDIEQNGIEQAGRDIIVRIKDMNLSSFK